MGDIGEAELLAAASTGEAFDGAVGAGRRRVDAELLRRCCLQLREQIDPRGLRLRNATVAGSVDLAGLHVPFPVRLHGCEFDSPLLAEGATLYELAVTACDPLPGLLANGVRIQRDLDLSGTHVSGAHRTSASTSKRSAIWLCESEIGGRLLCLDTVIDGTGGERAIQADRMRVLGNIRLLHQFTARGELRLIGAHIGGSLDLTAASIESAVTGLALDLGEAVIDGSVFLIDDKTRRPVISGRIDMGRARIGGQFLVRNATLAGHHSLLVGSAYSRARSGGTALNAPRLCVGAELAFDEECQITGGIDLAMSELSSVSIGPGCALTAPAQVALDLTSAELLSSFTLGSTVAGTVRLTGAHIQGNVSLGGANLSDPRDRYLVAAQGARIDGELGLERLTAAGGELGFRAATIGSFVDATGARLENRGGFTFDLTQATVRGTVRLSYGLESMGTLNLNRATIDGRLVFSQGRFDCPPSPEPRTHGDAIEAISADVRGGIDLGWKSVSPSVDFTNTRTSFLADDPATWPARFVVSGFTYDRFDRPQDSDAPRTWDHLARCAWLARQDGYDAGPYEQAARVFRQHGYTAEAEKILMAQRRHARQAISGRGALFRRGFSALYGVAVGYGFRPWRMLWLLLALLILVGGSLSIPAAQATMRATTSDGKVYGTHGPLSGGASSRTAAIDPASQQDACGNGEVRCFNSALFAIDTVIPLVTLDQRSTWYPNPNVARGTFMEWWLNCATLLGWLLSSILVLSLARFSRST